MTSSDCCCVAMPPCYTVADDVIQDVEDMGDAVVMKLEFL